MKLSNCATKNSRTNSIKGGECDNPPFGIKWSREQKSESRAELLGIKAIEGMLSFDHLRLNMDRRK